MRIVDGGPSDARLPGTGIREIFRPADKRQRYLDVEAALATAQAELGLIPGDAAERIRASARIELLDADRLAQAEVRTGHPMVALIGELSRVVGSEHGKWIHWGATTQNITQTADVLGVRQVHAVISDLMRSVLLRLADLGEETADMVMPGRTHGQQAVPMTLGFKVAAWADVMLRHLERLNQIKPRLFQAMTGGAVGTFAAMGASGRAVQDQVARQFGLGSMAVPSRSISDQFVELLGIFGMIAASGAAIAEEISRLMAVEFGELAEATPAGDVGSSTMPQKRNPKLCQEIIAFGAQIRALVPVGLEAMIHGHEVDGARSLLMEETVVQGCVLTGDVLTRLVKVLTELEVHPDRMRENLDLGGGLIMAEGIMMALAETLGRQEAHRLVHRAAGVANDSGESFRDVLANDPFIGEVLDPATIRSLLSPHTHSGLSAEIARETSERVRAVVGLRQSGAIDH